MRWKMPLVVSLVVFGQHSGIALAGSAVSIAAGATHTCSLLSNGVVKCWGNNASGQLGDGTQTRRLRPVRVLTLGGVAAVTAGAGHTCALLTNGLVKCWGLNRFGQLGDGTQTDTSVPVRVKNLRGVTAIAAGNAHTCALLSGASVKCWGNNALGQLGDGTTGHRFTPVRVGGLDFITSIAAGRVHSCVVVDTGEGKCWGGNSVGQLGDGTQTRRLNPVRVRTSGQVPFTAVYAGAEHTCAVGVSGRAKCWGSNSSGQLGDSTQTDRLIPVRVKHLSGSSTKVTDIGTALEHTCAVLDTGKAKCWGRNSSGQLGDGTQTNHSTPGAVKGLTGSTAIAGGESHTCALLPNTGEVMCWGDNLHGQLGDNSQTSRLTPVKVRHL